MAEGKGQPRAFSNGDDFENKFIDYIKYCKDIEYLTNIAGFCRFCGITRETFYKQKDYYSDTFNIIQCILEDEAINCKSIGDSFKKYYMSNKFNWCEKQVIDQTNRNRVEILDDLPTDSVK